MKKIMGLCILSIMFLISGCTGDVSKDVKEMETSEVSNDAKVDKIEKKPEKPSEPEIKNEDIVAIEFLNKEYHPIDVMNGNASEFINLDFKLTNNADKDIAGVKTNISFLDPFKEKMLSMNFVFDDTISAHTEYLTENLGLNYNQFMDEHAKLKDAEFSKMSMEYKIDDIIYLDDLGKLKEEFLSSNTDKVSVALTNKVFHPIDINKGVVQEFLELHMVITNKTDKNISALMGTMTFKNIFKDDILSLNWQTDTTIPANSDLEITGQGLNYNMFMSEHSILKNTSLDKILFNFKTTKILYEDGTVEEL